MRGDGPCGGCAFDVCAAAALVVKAWAGVAAAGAGGGGEGGEAFCAGGTEKVKAGLRGRAGAAGKLEPVKGAGVGAAGGGLAAKRKMQGDGLCGANDVVCVELLLGVKAKAGAPAVGAGVAAELSLARFASGSGAAPASPSSRLASAGASSLSASPVERCSHASSTYQMRLQTAVVGLCGIVGVGIAWAAGARAAGSRAE